MLTRILVTRLAPFMTLLTNLVQNGIVAGRQIYDTIDVLSAIQHLVRMGLALRTALVLMLDLKKSV